MNLLAEIYSEEMVTKMYKVLKLEDTGVGDLNGLCSDGNDGDASMLSTLAPRLWPFMRHSITSVRYSAIRTLVIYLYSMMLVTSVHLSLHSL